MEWEKGVLLFLLLQKKKQIYNNINKGRFVFCNKRIKNIVRENKRKEREKVRQLSLSNMQKGKERQILIIFLLRYNFPYIIHLCLKALALNPKNKNKK